MRDPGWLAAWGIGGAALLSLAAAWAAGGGTAPDGAAIFRDHCSVCHGDRGDGNSRARASLVPPPRDFTSAATTAELTRERMIASVRDGRPGTAMAAWGGRLDEAGVAAVVDYIRLHLMRPGTQDEAGRGLYARNCSVCHGDDGRGARWATGALDPPPRNFTLPLSRARLTRRHMIHVASFGRPDTAMPGFGTRLRPDQIGAVVDYIRERFMPALPPGHVEGETHVGAHEHGTAVAADVDMEAPFPGGLAGDAARGGAFYRKNCSTCHGLQGDGHGPRAFFILPRPRNFLLPGSRATYNRPALFAGISRGRVGSEMPAWNKVLSPQEIADVAEYVFQSFIRPDALAGR